MNQARLELDGESVVFRHGGRGPLLVLNHALGPLAWGPLERLQRSCTVAIPDWERSTLPEDERFVGDWIDAVARELGFEEAALAAWSMAGPAAVLFAAGGAPLTHLVLVDVAGLGPVLPPLRLRDIPQLLLTRLLGRPTRAFVRIMWRDWVHDPTRLDTAELEEATYRFFRDREEPSPPDDEDEDDADDAELEEVLERIEVPTLVLAGRHSSVLGPEAGRAAAERLPAGRLVVFEDSSHALQLEEPETFERVLADFLTE
jgi:pimeloyl-ACP methyl ester carboxylesterase